MRLKKGDRVEVLTKCELPSDCWRCATIISGNARKYNVAYAVPKYPQRGLDTDQVPRSAIRPMPPPIGGQDNLRRGDIVEVFHCGLWKAATVVTTGDRCYFFVRLHGSTGQKLHVHMMYLRLRQSWQDDQWFVTGKIHRKRATTTAVDELPLSSTKKIKLAAASQS